MNRRSFFGVVGCFATTIPLSVKPILPSHATVRLVRYVDPSLVGGVFNLVGVTNKPRKASQHYRNGEKLYRVEGNGLHLDVYADEIAAI